MMYKEKACRENVSYSFAFKTFTFQEEGFFFAFFAGLECQYHCYILFYLFCWILLKPKLSFYMVVLF